VSAAEIARAPGAGWEAPVRSSATVTRLRPRVDLDRIAVAWKLALDSAQRALDAAGFTLAPGEARQRRAALADERRRMAVLLERIVRSSGSRRIGWNDERRRSHE
jgi:hypothetical protein